MFPELATDLKQPPAPPGSASCPHSDIPTAHLSPPGSEPVANRAERRVSVIDPESSGRVYPLPGEQFLEFEILSELGRGSMGRVYLARQQAPTDRLVVLKVGQYLSSECKRLSKLQHPNIVPVYSFHQGELVQAVCMPYRGPLTLAHLVRRLQAEELKTLDGHFLTTAIEQCRQRQQAAVTSLPRDPAAAPAAEAAVPAGPKQLLHELRGLTYSNAVLTIIRQVAEGLRVAHAERIVHCDLKPANVLIADDGCAQLIDFGVAFDKSDAVSQLRLGGTRPYMSPEQLRSFAISSLEYDERTDLYSLGVILFELLTGRVPFAPMMGSSAVELEQERASRYAGPPAIRSINPRVPHAVASIIAKCLAPEVSDRYQTAAQLIEDLDRQMARRPLRFAANTSTREVVGKWTRRNRTVLAGIGLLSLTGAGFAGFANRDSHRVQEINRLEAQVAGEPFVADLEQAEFYFGMGEGDTLARQKAWESARRAFDRFNAWDDEGWYQRPEFQALEPERLDGYRRQLAGLMLLMSNSGAQQAARTTEPPARQELLRQAHAWNERAERTHPAPDGCRAVWIQRGFLARLEGDPAAAERFNRRAEGIPQNAADAALEGRQLLAEGRVQAALKVLTGGTRIDPKNFWARFYTAVCYQLLNQNQQAAAGFDICHSLRPDFFGTYFNRGQARLRIGRPAEAEEDFNRAIQMRPDWGDAYFQRGIAREVQTRYTDALEDLDRALKLGYSPTSVHLVRSRVYGRLGKAKAAEQDFAAGIKTVPNDERGWLARAQAQLYRDPAAALADYAEALKLNPRSVHALQGTAHLLSRTEKDDAAAAKALTRVIDVNPDLADAWSGRGVLRARMNDREGALADAREALRLSEHPATKYQVAGIYAMTSRTNPDDRREAYSLLDAALRDGFGFEYLKDDRELDPIRNEPEFQKTVDAARAYRTSLKKRD